MLKSFSEDRVIVPMMVFEEVERLISYVGHSEALALLEAMPHSQFSDRELAYYHVLVAETQAIIGKRTSSKALDDAIETFRFDPETALFARAKYAKGLWFTTEGEHGNAQETMLEAYTGFLRCQNLFHASRALNRLSYLSLQQGDVQAATDYLERATKIYRQLKDRKSEMRYEVNLSILYLLTGRLKDALTIYRSVEKDIGILNNHTRIVFLLTCAVTQSLRGEHANALETLEKTKPNLQKYPRQEIFYYQYLGWVHVNVAEYSAAEKSLITGLRLADEKKIAVEGTTIKRLLADAYVATGRLKEAHQYAQEVLAHAQKTNERAEIACCYRVFARIEQARGNPEKARIWFDKALEMMGLIFCRYELAETRCLAADCSAYSDDEKAYLLSLALEYFILEDVTHRVRLVEKKLKKIRRPMRQSDETEKRRRAGSGFHSELPVMIAKNQHMKELVEIAEKVAPSEISVFLTGPTGSGKDVMARYIHSHSLRPGQFVSINAAAVPDSMVESELFGHAKGAFTGADQDKPGLFELAHDGTFYLNEIADATPSFQAKLLEVIETRKVRRLGQNKQQPANFRLIAATNHDLRKRMDEGLFRPDLYHRLNEISLHLPALSERIDDIRPLIEHFLRISGFDTLHKNNPDQLDRLAAILSRREWPGNVRQLRAEINRLLLTSDRNLIAMIKLASTGGSSGPTDPYQELLEAIQAAGGNKSKAARALGIRESTLRYRLKKYEKDDSRQK